MTEAEALARVHAASFWSGRVDPVPLSGGMTNRNFLVRDAGRSYVARLGEDIPIHNVMRFNERAASMAAEAAGVSPALRHFEPGLVVIDFIEGQTLDEAGVRADLERVARLVHTAHREVTRHLKGPALAFWTFHVLRSYLHALEGSGHAGEAALPRLREVAVRLEAALGPTELVFGHNDLLPGNFLDDGHRLWLIDWDYGGFNAPLFDLGNLASNNGFDEAECDALLIAYHGHSPDAALRRRFAAMRVASLLRETLWSMVSELHSEIDVDYAAYTAKNASRFEAALADFESLDSH